MTEHVLLSLVTVVLSLAGGFISKLVWDKFGEARTVQAMVQEVAGEQQRIRENYLSRFENVIAQNRESEIRILAAITEVRLDIAKNYVSREELQKMSV